MARLRLIKRLLDAGHRPGRVVLASEAQLQGWLNAPPPPRAGLLPPQPGLAHFPASFQAPIPAPCPALFPAPCPPAMPARWPRTSPNAWFASSATDGLRQAPTQALLRQGLAAAVTQLFAPLTVAVGDAWMRGELQVFEEHVQRVPAAGAAPGPAVAARTGRPARSPVLLTTSRRAMCWAS